MNIAFVASEAFPYAKTGGLADVAGALPKALEKLGCHVKLFIPKYGNIDEKKFRLKFVEEIKISVSVAGVTRTVYLHQALLPGSGVEVNFIDCPHYFFRKSIYTNDNDEDERFILFNKAVIELLDKLNWKPDIIHCNDWQTGLIPYYLKEHYNGSGNLKDAASIFTIHNVGYQGQFSEETFYKAEIKKERVLTLDPDHRAGFSFMKNAVIFSDLINTVSRTYALEILTSEYGAGMEKFLGERKTDLFGIVNGIDYSEWNSLTDEYIPYHFNFENIEGKREIRNTCLNNSI